MNNSQDAEVIKRLSTLVSVPDFEKEAKKQIREDIWEYYRGGANFEQTLKLNISAFDEIRLRPRFFCRDLTNRNLSTKVSGINVDFPIGIAPTAMQRMAHPLGEIGTAKACQLMNTIYIMSTLSTTSIEEVALAVPGATKWFQLYIFKDRKTSVELVRRAENAGFKAIVITVDVPIAGQRYHDMRNKFSLPSNLRLANLPVQMGKNKDASAFLQYIANNIDPSITWKDFEWFTKQTKLPVFAKGILTQEDAQLAISHGASAIVVSNHGARQLDSVAASIEVLPEIVKSVGNQCEIYLDGGIRSGLDALKAIALGAKMVFMGRPAIWGLGCGGEHGVKKVLEIVRTEFDTAMALCGAQKVTDICPAMVCKSNMLWSNL